MVLQLLTEPYDNKEISYNVRLHVAAARYVKYTFNISYSELLNVKVYAWKPSFDINYQGLGLSHCEVDY
jgi:hypothetical protein